MDAGKFIFPKINFNQKVKGGALYISVLVSIIMGVILTLFILVANYNQRRITVFAQSSQLYYNLKSGFQMAQSAYFNPELNNKWIKNQVNDDSIRVKKMNWGAYLILSCETKNRHERLLQSGLFGTSMNADTGLIISDNSRPVGMSGKVILKAKCYLPKSGIKPAYIEGQSYISSGQNATYIKNAPAQIPQVNAEIKKGLKEQLNKLNIYLDSSVNILPESFEQRFDQKTVVWENSQNRLSNLNLKNNIKIICGNIEIENTVQFENVLVICNKVRFKKGFKGKVHVIARDSISMEEGCSFEYPSSFVLFSEEGGNGEFKTISFNKDCRFFGGVLAFKEHSESLSKVFVKLHTSSEINGFVYSEDYIHLEGMINAIIIANKLLLKTPSAVYENHLLGCEINPGKYGHLLATPLVFHERAVIKCCEMIH